MNNLSSKSFLVAVFAILFISTLISQDRFPDRVSDPSSYKSQFNHIPKKPGHYTATDWAVVIDATWGPGLPGGLGREPELAISMFRPGIEN